MTSPKVSALMAIITLRRRLTRLLTPPQRKSCSQGNGQQQEPVSQMKTLTDELNHFNELDLSDIDSDDDLHQALKNRTVPRHTVCLLYVIENVTL